MYDWRKLTPAQRTELLQFRRQMSRPWHSPPHRASPGLHQYIVTGACYQHAPVVGHSHDRMEAFLSDLLQAVSPFVHFLHAWCLLPNHYHLVVSTEALKPMEAALGVLHGRSSYQWNGEDGRRQRKVWHTCADREMRSDAHLWTTINYVHNNPVRHGYVQQWQEWPWSSADDFLKSVGREQAERIWRAFPVKDYGKGWDEAEV